MKKLINKYILLLVIAIGVFISSCEDPNDWGVDESYNRMFRPATCTVDNVTATTAEVTFAKVNGVKLYVIEISHDSLTFDKIVSTIEINTDTIETSGVSGYKLKLINLFGNTPHSVRIKVTSSTDVPDSKYATVYFKTKAEQIMSQVGASDKTSENALIKWQAGALVTHLVVTPAGGTPQRIDLSDTEKAAGSKLLTGLTEETNYTVEIYNTDANKRGTITFLTYSNPPAADRIVWLAMADTLAIQTVIDSCTATSLTIVLPNGNYTYRSGTDIPLVIKAGLKMLNIYALPGTVKTKLKIKSFSLPTTVAMTALSFENLNVVGYDYTADYCLNPSEPVGTISTVSFKNCQLSDFRGVLRIRNALTVTNFIMTGCIVSHIKDYGLITADTDGNPLIDNITIEGSTFTGMDVFIQHRYRNSTSINISNCTFYDMITSKKYFVDYNGTTLGPNTFSITNCIFSKARYVESSGVLTYGSGYRASIVPTVSNCYKTSDYITQSATYDFPGLVDYGKTSAVLFTDPASGNFLIMDNTFAGKSTAGDPRWRPAE
jgi:hypothetical protein